MVQAGIHFVIDFVMYSIVLMVQFTSANFDGSESSGEVLVSLALSGGVSTSNVTIMISLYGLTATGNSTYVT